MQPRNPQGQRLHDILSDSRWHDREYLIADVALYVPYGPAVRRAVKERKRKRKSRTDTSSTDDHRRMDDFTAGSRSFVTEMIYNWHHRGVVEHRYTDDGRREYRLVP